MKKILQISLIFLIVLTTASCGKKNKENSKNIPQSIDEVLEDKTITKQGDIELSNINITASGSMNIVTATIKNAGSNKKTFNAVLYMKNKEGLTLGKIEENIKDLEPKKTKDISVEIMGDYTTVNTYELLVEGLVEE